jgi:hypothetical protein
LSFGFFEKPLPFPSSLSRIVWICASSSGIPCGTLMTAARARGVDETELVWVQEESVAVANVKHVLFFHESVLLARKLCDEAFANGIRQ